MRMALERMPYDIQSNAPHNLFNQYGMNDRNKITTHMTEICTDMIIGTVFV